MARAAPLAPYRAKCDFSRTSEPAPDEKVEPTADGPIFIVLKAGAPVAVRRWGFADQPRSGGGTDLTQHALLR